METIQPSTLPKESESERVAKLRGLVKAHTGSFDFAMGRGVRAIADEIEDVYLDPVDVEGVEGEQSAVIMQLEEISVMRPVVMARTTKSTPVYPRQAREMSSTYKVRKVDKEEGRGGGGREER